MGIFRFFLSPYGRIGRAKWWLGLIAVAIISIALQIWLLASVFGYDVFDPTVQALAKPAQQALGLFTLLLLYPFFVICAKRLHDRGKSAWWALVFVVPLALWIAASVLGFVDSSTPDGLAASSSMGLGTVGLVILAMLWAVIDLGILGGTPGENSYGPEPVAG